MTIHEQIKNQLKSLLNIAINNPIEQLNNALRLLSKWRSLLIQNTLLKESGTTILNGPFKGIDFIEQSAEGCHVAKLLGCYEQPLLPYIQKAIDKKYSTILNIGCAEGYYAVGMAKNMPNTQVYAYDIDENARNTTKKLSIKNGVENRVHVGGLFKTEDFNSFIEAHKDSEILLLCDIEGAEDELLNIEIASSLANIDIILEAHETHIAGITNKLVERFKATHEIQIIHDNGQRSFENTPEWFYNIAHLDQLLAVWEWRSGATPWLVMTSKNKAK